MVDTIHSKAKGVKRWEELIRILKGNKVWIQPHNFPDPDAIASAYGLRYFLDCYGISSQICYSGSVDKISVSKMLTCLKINMLTVAQADLSCQDVIVMVDGQKYNTNMTRLIGSYVACIDHHPTVKACTYLYKDIRVAGACASLIAQYIQESGVPLNEQVASALFYGLKMDTDSLNRGVTRLDVAMYNYLYDYTDQQLVGKMYNNNMELSDLYAYKMAINAIKIYEDLGIAYLPFECEDGLVAMVCDFLLKLDGVSVAVIYAEKQGGLKFSVRSKENDIHAGYLVGIALEGIGSGGGHPTMAGGLIPIQNRVPNQQLETYQIQQRFIHGLNVIKQET